MATKTLGELRLLLILQKEKFEKGMQEVVKTTKEQSAELERAGRGMVVFGGAMLGVAGMAVKTAADFEFLQTRLQALFNSTERGNEEFAKMVEIARKVPFTLRSVSQAGATLAAFLGDQKDQLSELLPKIADLAAFMGEDVPLAAASFGRAFASGAGAADMLRDRGVLALVALKGGFKTATEMTKAFEGRLPEFRKLLIETLSDPNTGIAGATGRLIGTLQGQLSMLKDAVDILAASFGKTLLPTVTESVKALTAFTNKVNKLPDWMKKTAMETTAGTGALSLFGGTALIAASQGAQLAVALQKMGKAGILANKALGAFGGVLAALLPGIILFRSEVNRLNEKYNKMDEASAALNDDHKRLTFTLATARGKVAEYTNDLFHLQSAHRSGAYTEDEFNKAVKHTTGLLESAKAVLADATGKLKLYEDAAKGAGEETEKMSDAIVKAMLAAREHMADRLKALTLDEFAYRRWKLDQELAALEQVLGKKLDKSEWYLAEVEKLENDHTDFILAEFEKRRDADDATKSRDKDAYEQYLTELEAKWRDKNKYLVQAADQTAGSVGDAFAKMVETGEFALDDFAASFRRMLAQILGDIISSRIREMLMGLIPGFGSWLPRGGGGGGGSMPGNDWGDTTRMNGMPGGPPSLPPGGVPVVNVGSPSLAGVTVNLMAPSGDVLMTAILNGSETSKRAYSGRVVELGMENLSDR